MSSLLDGDIPTAAQWKEYTSSLQAIINGGIGNPNITDDGAQKIAYSKLDLDGSIQDSDIVGVSVLKFTSLKAIAQTSPNNTVKVQAGSFLASDRRSTIKLAVDTNSGAFANTGGAGLNRIDHLTIDDLGALVINQGDAEAASPVADDYNFNETPICQIFCRYNAGGSLVIRDTDNGTDSYILTDSRPAIANPYKPRLEIVRATDNVNHNTSSFVDMPNMELKWPHAKVPEAVMVFACLPLQVEDTSGTALALQAETELMYWQGTAWSSIDTKRLTLTRDAGNQPLNIEANVMHNYVRRFTVPGGDNMSGYKIRWRVTVGDLVNQFGAAVERSLMVIRFPHDPDIPTLP
jgi:hypothetical protein